MLHLVMVCLIIIRFKTTIYVREYRVCWFCFRFLSSVLTILSVEFLARQHQQKADWITHTLEITVSNSVSLSVLAAARPCSRRADSAAQHQPWWRCHRRTAGVRLTSVSSVDVDIQRFNRTLLWVRRSVAERVTSLHVVVCRRRYVSPWLIVTLLRP